jgi:hypothetical protein
MRIREHTYYKPALLWELTVFSIAGHPVQCQWSNAIHADAQQLRYNLKGNTGL